MQKKLIALAVAGLASTAAFAQTNVTVYGIADGTFDIINVDNALNPANDFGSFNRVSANSSYIGFKGTEDLGNGLKAVFQFENSVAFDSTGGTFAARDSYVGLSSGFGTLVMGNLTAPTRALGATLDVNAGATGIGANSGLIGKYSGVSGIGEVTSATGGNDCAKSATCTSVFDTRWANAIAYMSPNWGGFSFAGAYVADENKSSEGANNTASAARTTGFDVGAKWEGYGFMVGATYNWFQRGDVNGRSADNLRLGGMYSGGWGSVRAMWEVTNYEQISNVNLNGVTFNSDQQQKWGVGGTFNIGKAALLAQYYQALDSDNVTANGAWLAEVGVQYSLSKRTMLKAVYAYLDNDALSKADFGVNAAGTIGYGATLQGVQMGVRHAF